MTAEPLASMLGAVQFLTRVPIGTGRAADRRAILPWFPVVGGLVGTLVGAVAVGVEHVVAPLPAAAVAVAAGMVLTGAFHEDGLADSADAVVGGATRARRFEILDDPRLGSYGTAALCASVLVRVSAVATLLGAGSAATFASLVTAHALARGAVVGLLAAVPPAVRPGGADTHLGVAFGEAVSWRRATVAVVAALAVGAVAVGWWIGPLAAAGVVAIGLVGWTARRALGGLTGDVLGAAEQVAESAILVVAAGLAIRHDIWWR